ncbi:hypothetical protein [Helicobacter cholecystus]|uniref:hypothetical protein n=1 Tax=Helicobacter cholecystus TaxID=45498 RepID=UPI00273A0ECA|nr:hypothetical protein [Helicobacter cholecystus]
MGSQINFLAKSGYKGTVWLVALLGVSLLFGLGSLCFIFLIFLIFWLILFRNPERNALHLSENAFLAPIDGVITEISSTANRCQIKIKNQLFDVGVIRSPRHIQAYTLSEIHGIPLFFSNKKSLFNSEIVFSFGENKMIFYPQIFKFYPLNLNLNELERGERMGFMKGEIILEIEGIETKVNVGDRVKGGESVLGYLQ